VSLPKNYPGLSATFGRSPDWVLDESQKKNETVLEKTPLSFLVLGESILL
jgi:hypothetical protein